DRLHALTPAALIGPILTSMPSSDGLRIVRHTDPMRIAPLPSGEVWSTLQKALTFSGADPVSDWDAARSMVESLAAREQSFPPPASTTPVRFTPAIDPAAALAGQPAKTTVTQLRRGRGRLTEVLLDGD